MCTRTRWPAPTTGLSEFEQRALALLSIKCPGLLDEVGPGTVGRVQIQIQIMLQPINRHEAGLCCNMKGYSDNRTFQSKHPDTPRGAHGVTVFFAAARLIYPPAYQRHCTCCVKQLSPPSSGIFFCFHHYCENTSWGAPVGCAGSPNGDAHGGLEEGA